MKKIICVFLCLLCFSSLYAQKIIRKEIFSPKMNKKIKTIIITPDLKPNVAYKTVYILHGFSGTPERLVKEDLPGLDKKAKDYNTIYILPDGNFSSWYVDSPVEKKSQYQTFIGKELVDYIDKNFPTQKDKKSRAILGWSMGGYGAINIGVTYKDTFGIVGSSCGALDFKSFGNNFEKYQVDKVLGPIQSLNAKYLTDSKIDSMVNSGQHYILDCGTEDVQMIGMNRKFHQELTKRKIQHLYIESLGEHNTAYWSRSLSDQLALFNLYFKI
ncbi:S-formylglutathione hydrolase FrmB [Chryseobacterium arachidis]|uniref:S-formylglutathione hydrolase FrmB n=1 Tax=Chryseobacterium arachidis TaxID=1416778 RepID=A0A1M5G771_9FLAO|nr:alpha/beta hydrolase-fold protein [Chryseobacterium arachidis]SHF99524.1 S-formylglutathione hydrolase FrmB [Chryseobacterium arachidis]